LHSSYIISITFIEKRKIRIKYLKKLVKLCVVLGSIGVLGCLSILGIFIYISFDLPQISSLSDYNPPISSQILSKDGEVLLDIGTEQRELVAFENIPEKVVQSFLAAEDDNFYQHSGVDYLGVARAMVKNIIAGRVVQGGSTITQQVAKSLLLSRKKTYTRKIKDFLLAQKIEEKFSKQDILFLYLNQIYLGGGYYGIKAAFKGYFGKELEDVTTAETALIAGLLVAPASYSPYRKPKFAKKRQTYVLGRLFKTGKITQEEYDAAKSEVIKIRKKVSKGIKAGYFTDWIRQRVIGLVGKKKFLTGGFEVLTTLDWDLQKVAEASLTKGVKAVDKRQGYKGPLAFKEESEFEDFYKSYRIKTYKKASTFFYFNTDGSTDKEIVFEEDEVSETLVASEELKGDINARKLRNIYPGVPLEDSFIDYIKEKTEHRAIVLGTNDLQRIVYVSIGGLSGIIPYDNFKWAHERKISEDRKYWSYVTKPSLILKRGDVVLVKIMKKPKMIHEYFNTAFKSKLRKDKRIKKFFKQNKYFICFLEQEPDVEGALLSLHPKSGDVISMVGGYSFKKSQFNRTIQSNRQPGSSFKPFLYAAGLEHGFKLNSIILDSPQALGGGENSLDWKPRNYDGKFKGEMTFRKSLEVSRNIPTIKIVQDVGVGNMISFSERLKINAKMPKDLSISLGAFGIKLFDLVKAYAIFPNNGKLVRTRSIISIKDRFGKFYPLEDGSTPGDEHEHKHDETKDEISEIIKEELKEESKDLDTSDVAKVEVEEEKKINPYIESLGGDQVYDPRLSYLMSNLLMGVIKNGTGRNTRDISSFIGGKTGTTNSFVDALFLGFSNQLATGVWVGFDNNKTIGWGETGAKSSLPIWRTFMAAGIKKFGESMFEIPEGIVNVRINKLTGRLSEVVDENTFSETFVEGTEPGKEVADEKDDDNTQILIDDDDYYSN
jgi:penicillin-binding protein 1A